LRVVVAAAVATLLAVAVVRAAAVVDCSGCGRGVVEIRCKNICLSVNRFRLPNIIFYMEKRFPVYPSGPMRGSHANFERTWQTFFGHCDDGQRLLNMLVSLGGLWGNVVV